MRARHRHMRAVMVAVRMNEVPSKHCSHLSTSAYLLSYPHACALANLSSPYPCFALCRQCAGRRHLAPMQPGSQPQGHPPHASDAKAAQL